MMKKNCKLKIVDKMLICLAALIISPGCNPPKADLDESKNTTDENAYPSPSSDSETDTVLGTSSDDPPADSDGEPDPHEDLDTNNDSDPNDSEAPDDAVDTDSGKTSDPYEPTDSDSDNSCICECNCDEDTDSDTTSDYGADSDSDTTSDYGADSDSDSDTTSDYGTDSDSDTTPDSGADSDTTSDSGAEDAGTIDEACLIISEYIEGSSWNKGIEIYNCGQETVSLDGTSLCVYTNDSVECSNALDLTGDLAAEQVMTLCHSSAEELGSCDVKSGSVNFSGDDRIALMREDTVTDAFGELAVRPENTPWADITLRRCNLTPYLGDTAFDLSKYFSTAETDDSSDFGLAPTAGACE